MSNSRALIAHKSPSPCRLIRQHQIVDPQRLVISVTTGATVKGPRPR